MRPTRFFAMALTGVGVIIMAGCGQTYFPDALDATLEEVDLIRNSDTLEPQEMREELAELLGIEDPNDPDSFEWVLINGLLQAERLANQFGGDLSSAYDKVVNDQFSELTPDEVQFYADATEQTPLDMEDAEAQAIVNLFRDNDIDSADELEDWLDNPANELPAGIDEENLRGVFIEADPEDVRDEL